MSPMILAPFAILTALILPTRAVAEESAVAPPAEESHVMYETDLRQSFDVGNQKMLQAGARAAHGVNDGGGWVPMDSAPHDGTVIEIKNSYGVAPSYGLYRWIDDMGGRWAQVGQDNSSFDDGPKFSWRPYLGDPAHYVDPTHGAQRSAAYWRGAAAAVSGLPPDAFEVITQHNLDANGRRTPRPWWLRWMDW
jgi:hypothetical protein